MVRFATVMASVRDAVPLSEREEVELSVAACDWACAHALLTVRDGRLDHIPFSLTPRRFPQVAFDHAALLSRPFNTLTDRIAREYTWLRGVLAE
jgi:hypothetical protein